MDDSDSKDANILIKVMNPKDGKIQTIIVPVSQQDSEDDNAIAIDIAPTQVTNGNGSSYSERTWSYEGTLALLKLLQENVKDLNNFHKKRQVYIKVSHSLKELGYNFTVPQIYNKWKFLIRSYRRSLRETKLGHTSRYMYNDEMRELLPNITRYKDEFDGSLQEHGGNIVNMNLDHAYHEDSFLESFAKKKTPAKSTSTTTAKKVKTTIETIGKIKVEANIKEEDLEQQEQKVCATYLFECEKNKQARHRERMGLENRKVELLESILGQLNNK